MVRPGGPVCDGWRCARYCQARFVVDASGQSGLLGRMLQLRRWDSFFQNLAVYGYFAGAQRLSAPDDTNIFIEAYPHGWLWNIPLHTGWMSVGAVVDSHTGQEGLRRSDPQRFLAEQLAQAPYTAHMLHKARLAAGPFVVKDWSYTSDHLVGDGYILVGDAACFVDPLFSSGVHLALMAGVLAAAYVTSALKDPSMRTAAGQMYTALYRKEYEHFRAMAQLFYASNRTVDSYFGRRDVCWEALTPSHPVTPLFVPSLDSHRVGTNVWYWSMAPLRRSLSPACRRWKPSARHAEHGWPQCVPRLIRRLLPSTRPYRILPPALRYSVKPILAAGEFVWGHVLITAGYPEGTPCSDLVAELVRHIDGRTSVAELLAILCADRGRAACADRHQRPYSPADPLC